MKISFPEIEIFFSNRNFTAEELAEFKEKVRNYYKQVEVKKQALALIELKLSFFELAPLKEITKTKNNSQNPYNKRKTITVPKKITKNLKSLSEINGKTIKEASKYVDGTLNVFIQTLKKAGFNVQPDETITSHQIIGAKDYLNNRIERLNKREIIAQQDFTKRHKKNSDRRGDDVYGELTTHGMNKLIYTKMK